MAAVVHQSSVTTVEEPLPTPGNSGAKLFFGVAGLAAGWYLYQTGTVADVAKDSFRPPFRVKTTYLLYATTIAGYFVGGAVGNILYGNPNKKQTTKTTVKH